MWSRTFLDFGSQKTAVSSPPLCRRHLRLAEFLSMQSTGLTTLAVYSRKTANFLVAICYPVHPIPPSCYQWWDFRATSQETPGACYKTGKTTTKHQEHCENNVRHQPSPICIELIINRSETPYSRQIWWYEFPSSHGPPSVSEHGYWHM